MQLNTQKPEKRVESDGRELSVHSIFHTIQGEGPFCGTPAVFVRLAGCNLQCPQCDTNYTTGRKMMKTHEILREVLNLTEGLNKTRLVVITGGEPFRQELSNLFDLLFCTEFFVQVESNGTLAPPEEPENTDLDHWFYNHNAWERNGVYIVCSPKAGKVHPKIHQHCCAYKYVGGRHNLSKEDGLPLRPLEHPSAKGVPRPKGDKDIYLQPTDEQDETRNAFNLKACVESCLKHGYILQLQIHKLIGVA